MFGIPLNLVVSFTLFATFLFYQQKHASNFQGASQTAGLVLSIWAGLGFLFEIGFLIYFGYIASAWSAVKLLGLSIALWIPLMIIEVSISAKAPVFPALLSIAGLAVVPFFGYLMIRALP